MAAAAVAGQMERLHLSVNTICNHIQKIRYKFNAHSKLQAVATAVREGILDPHRGAGS